VKGIEEGLMELEASHSQKGKSDEIDLTYN
jgi:hypothetical protein